MLGSEIDVEALSMFAEGYNEVVETSMTLLGASLRQITEGAQPILIRKMIAEIEKLKSWSNSSVKDNKQDVKDIKNLITGYQTYISERLDFVYKDVCYLCESKYNEVNVVKLKNQMRLLSKASNVLTERLTDQTFKDICVDLRDSYETAKTEFNNSTSLLATVPLKLESEAKAISDKLATLRSQRYKGFSSMVHRIWADVELREGKTVVKENESSPIDVKGEFTGRETPIEETVVTLAVKVAIGILVIGIIALCVNTTKIISDDIDAYRDLGRQIEIEKKKLAEIEPVYAIAREITESASRFMGGLDRLAEYFPKVAKLLIAQNEERQQILRDLEEKINDANWSSKEFKVNKEALEVHMASFKKIMKIYAMIRAIDKEKRIYYVIS
ncbi:hypothetical protein [Pseudomonas agarici]|uniref:hypothetical protein n=3 Tax=Pseudomonas agarici TaxID=46677 RepID=UPI0008CA4760|nr:hypothetical protein [Pseudomonas agarici]NWB91408.1 hypothetical protein [Pseudomonas agarici]NWC07844.1 hypothetical protein [Pseudomonas agarici]SEK75927.1 hypothetical protein SAMN05216604_106112 [Pseudomonas agarici]